ncbi:hypothetical protein BO78DRAFT_275643, partial [Aspergillus sclerotiicarbonarius CBS 121057]
TSTSKLSIAISIGESIYKHWSLSLSTTNTKTNPQTKNLTFQILGSSNRYRFDINHNQTNPLASNDLIQMIYLYDVDTSHLQTIRSIAEKTVIHNEIPSYNCQDYVLDLLDLLEKSGVIDNQDEGYVRNKGVVKGMQEGL